MTSFRNLTLSVIALALTITSVAHAQSTTPRSRDAYLHTELGAGYWHYWQSHYADRETDGFATELHGAFAWHFGDEVAVGTAFSLQLYYGTGHRYSDGSQIGPDTNAGGLWGFLFAWTPSGDRPPISLELSAGFAGAGAVHDWGGFGPYLSPALTIFFAHAGRSHFGVTARVQYEPMFSDDATPHGAQKNFVFASLALGWTLF
jgi:hypothetical protein